MERPSYWYEAYKTVYGFLTGRKRDYQMVFGSPAGQRVLEDLMVFCRANDTCFNENERVTMMLEGRREVYLRICKHLKLSPEQLVDMFGGQPVVPRKDE